jgi:hypothetical protein
MEGVVSPFQANIWFREAGKANPITSIGALVAHQASAGRLVKCPLRRSLERDLMASLGREWTKRLGVSGYQMFVASIKTFKHRENLYL